MNDIQSTGRIRFLLIDSHTSQAQSIDRSISHLVDIDLAKAIDGKIIECADPPVQRLTIDLCSQIGTKAHIDPSKIDSNWEYWICLPLDNKSWVSANSCAVAIL